MSNVREVLFERIINHHIETKPNGDIDLKSSGPIWGEGDSRGHQEWLFGGGASLRKLSLDNRGALTDEINGHPGVDRTDVTQDVVDSVQAVISAMRDCYGMFPVGSPAGGGYKKYDLYSGAKHKVEWAFDHGFSHAKKDKSGDFQPESEHTGY